jgi:hypothetical protein
MLIEWFRFVSNDVATLSIISIDKQFFGFGLEDAYQKIKIPGKTRIAAGTYDIHLRDAGGMNIRYAKKFSDFHEGMLWVQDVKNFEWIYHHIGNNAKHTEGCGLVGYGCNRDTMTIQTSTKAYSDYYKIIVDAARRKELKVTYIDGDRKNDF